MTNYLINIFLPITMVALVSCARTPPERQVGVINSFSPEGNRIKVNIKDIDTGWYLQLKMQNFEDRSSLFKNTFIFKIINTNKTELNVSFLYEDYVIRPGETLNLFEGTFKEYWDNGGVILVHTGHKEPILNYTVEILCPDQPKLVKPLKLVVYTVLPSL